jgi:energy-coupling factor transporter ATP-binding protein EcfA2
MTFPSLESVEFYALLGPSGCRKVTLLRLMAGSAHPERDAVMLYLRHNYVLSRGMGMPGNSFCAIADLDDFIAIAHPDLLARILPQNRVAAALPRYVSISGHFPQLVIAVRIGWPSGRQAELLGIPAEVYLFPASSRAHAGWLRSTPRSATGR